MRTGASRLPRQRHRRGLDGGRYLAAEAAADLRRDHPHPGHGHVEYFRDGVAQGELGLGGDPHRRPPRGVEARQRGMGFDVGLVHHGRVEAVLEDPVGLGETALHVAPQDLLVVAHVAAPVLHAGLRPVVGMAVVDQRRVRLHGLQSRRDRRKHLVVHLDEARRFLGRLLVHRRHRGDAVADVAHLGAGEILLVADEFPVADRGQVGRGHHGLDARQPLGPLGADGGDAGVGVGAQHHLAVEHLASRRHVRAEHRLPGDLLEDLDPG